MLAYGFGPDKLQWAFLIKEWVDDMTQGSLKYINNGCPTSCLGNHVSAAAHDIAEFLSFVQHVQWCKMGFTMFTSDYQGQLSLSATSPQLVQLYTDHHNTSQFRDAHYVD
jgi:hypothetical protein